MRGCPSTAGPKTPPWPNRRSPRHTEKRPTGVRVGRLWNGSELGRGGASEGIVPRGGAKESEAEDVRRACRAFPCADEISNQDTTRAWRVRLARPATTYRTLHSAQTRRVRRPIYGQG